MRTDKPTILPKALRTEYRENFSYFDQWATTHRDHQKDAISAIRNKDKGQISLPTGTGKTRVQVHIHIEDMILKTKTKQLGTYVLAAHRLALCKQLLDDVVDVAYKCGLSFSILFIGSTRSDEDEYSSLYLSYGVTGSKSTIRYTTNPHEILEQERNSRVNNRHLIIVTTYHSFNRMKLLDEKIDICTYDEAHVTIADDFIGSIKEIMPQIKRNFFFTATRRIRGHSFGMNDISIYGEILYEISPRAMIDAAEIVGPKLHMIHTIEEGDYKNNRMFAKMVMQGFIEHRKRIKESSCCPELIGAKLLVTTNGTDELFGLFNEPMFREWITNEKISLFAFSSSNGYYIGFEEHSRNTVMSRMQKIDNNIDAIILHIDILTEGIDLPSITGVMPFRELNTTKLLQTLGRAARLFSEDRKNLYAGNILPTDKDKMVKPFCWMILPEAYGTLGNAEQLKSTLHDILTTYQIPVEEFIPNDEYTTEKDPDMDRITSKDTPKSKDKQSELIHIIKDVFDEIVQEKLCNIPVDNILKQIGANDAI